MPIDPPNSPIRFSFCYKPSLREFKDRHPLTELQNRNYQPLRVWASSSSFYKKLEVILKISEKLVEMHTHNLAHGNLHPETIEILKSENGEQPILTISSTNPLPYLIPSARPCPDPCAEDPKGADVFALGAILYEILPSSPLPYALFHAVKKNTPPDRRSGLGYLCNTRQTEICEAIDTLPLLDPLQRASSKELSTHNKIRQLLKEMLCIPKEPRCAMASVKRDLSAILETIRPLPSTLIKLPALVDSPISEFSWDYPAYAEEDRVEMGDNSSDKTEKIEDLMDKDMVRLQSSFDDLAKDPADEDLVMQQSSPFT